MTVLFIDACPTILAKSFLPLANYIKQRDENFKAYFVSLEFASYSSPEIDLNSIVQIVQAPCFKFVKFKSLNRNKIETFVRNKKPDAIFTNGYRVYDQLWIGIGKQLNISTFKLQQGFEIDSVYFKPFAIISKFTKVVRMSHALYSISCITEAGFLKLLSQYFMHLFKEKSLNKTALFNSKLHPDITFVYSEFYKNFWNKKHGFNKENMVLITPIDFSLIPKVQASIKQNACCYITQTLVEDGRMNRKEFIEHLSSYKMIASRIEKLIIKLHPRANADFYYKTFEGFKNVEFTREFPNCTAYLTHYSSMAFTATFFSNTVILHELKGHPTPEIFRNVATDIAFDVNQIIKILDKNDKNDIPNIEDKKRSIEYYVIFEDINPYEKIFDKLQSVLCLKK